MTHRWLIDFDSVLSNTFKHQVEAVNERFGLSLTPHDFPDWESSPLTPEQAAFMWGDELFLNEDFQMECTTVEGGSAVLRKLLWRGDVLYVVSDRPQVLFDVTKRWILKNIGIDLPLILTRSTVSKSDQDPLIPTKQMVVDMLDLNKIVDDAPHHAKAYSAMLFSNIETIYLMDTPSNQNVEESNVLIRVPSWDAVYASEVRLAEKRSEVLR